MEAEWYSHAHPKNKMTSWFVWLLSREGNKEISKVFMPHGTLIHPWHAKMLCRRWKWNWKVLKEGYIALAFRFIINTWTTSEIWVLITIVESIWMRLSIRECSHQFMFGYNEPYLYSFTHIFSSIECGHLMNVNSFVQTIVRINQKAYEAIRLIKRCQPRI
jgi:hypothetical protein